MSIDMFLKINGVEGESVDSRHAKEIDVVAWSWGMDQAAGMQSAGASVGKVNMRGLSITKRVDASTPSLMRACASGMHFPDAKLTLRSIGRDPLEYLRVTLKDVLVTSLTEGAQAVDERPQEVVVLSFAQVTVEYTPQNAAGMGGGLKVFAWNLQQNRPA